MRYLDHAATTPMRPEAVEAMQPYLSEAFGNPSGVHQVSRRAKNAIEEARERAADLIGAAHPLEVVFTGGGTEADNLAVSGWVLAGADRGVVTVATEHEAVLESARFVARLGRRVSFLGVDQFGRVHPGEVPTALHGPAVVSVMAANNETGVLQPVAGVAAEARAAHPDVVVHSDAVQAFVSEDVTVSSLDCDLLSLAAHKFGGPKGVGLLYVRNGVDLEPVLHGGGQELGRRSGTHNVAGVVGMVAAMEAAEADRPAFRDRVAAMRDEFEAVLLERLPDTEVTGPIGDRLVQHSHVRFPGVRADTLLVRLDRAGVCASAGSACQSGAIEPSHVLLAMGKTEREAAEHVRFTFGWDTSHADAVAAASTVADLVADLR